MSRTALPPQDAAAPSPARPLLVGALLVPLAYLLWLPLMFAAGYGITDLMDVYPAAGATEEMTEIGLFGWVAAIAFGLVAGLPGWIGAALAWGARRRGSGWPALAAGLVGLATALLLATSVLPA